MMQKRCYITATSLAQISQRRPLSVPLIKKSPIKIHPPLPGPPFKDVMKEVDARLKSRYDLEGIRTALLSKKKGGLKPGMVVTVQSYNSYPNMTSTAFSGYLMGIKRAGIESSIRLRTAVMRIGTEMRFPVFSPTIKDITVIREKSAKKIRRAKLFYIRDERHDKGSVDHIVKSVRNQAKK